MVVVVVIVVTGVVVVVMSFCFLSSPSFIFSTFLSLYYFVMLHFHSFISVLFPRCIISYPSIFRNSFSSFKLFFHLHSHHLHSCTFIFFLRIHPFLTFSCLTFKYLHHPFYLTSALPSFASFTFLISSAKSSCHFLSY